MEISGNAEWLLTQCGVLEAQGGSSAGHCPAENNEGSCISEAINPGELAGKTERSQERFVNSGETHPREDWRELLEA